MTSRLSFSKWQTGHKHSKAVFYLIVQWIPVKRAQQGGKEMKKMCMLLSIQIVYFPIEKTLSKSQNL